MIILGQDVHDGSNIGTGLGSEPVEATNKDLKSLVVCILFGCLEVIDRDRVDGMTTAVWSRGRVSIGMMEASELDKFGNVMGLGEVDGKVSGSFLVLKVKTKEFCDLGLKSNIVMCK